MLKECGHQWYKKNRPYWDPIPDEHNDVNLGVVINDDENRKVTLFYVIRFKGTTRKLEPGYKPAYQV